MSLLSGEERRHLLILAPDSTELFVFPSPILAVNLLEMVMYLPPSSCCCPLSYSPAPYNLVLWPHDPQKLLLISSRKKSILSHPKGSLGIFIVAASSACSDHHLVLKTFPQGSYGSSGSCVIPLQILCLGILYGSLDIPWLLALFTLRSLPCPWLLLPPPRAITTA